MFVDWFAEGALHNCQTSGRVRNKGAFYAALIALSTNTVFFFDNKDLWWIGVSGDLVALGVLVLSIADRLQGTRARDELLKTLEDLP